MGLMDQLIGGALSSALGGGQNKQAASPLGTIISSLTGGNSTQSSTLLSLVMSLILKNGGLDGILGMFQQKGMTKEANSWVSTGPNMDISGSQLQKVMGTDAISNIASQLGMSSGQASTAIAQILPELINQLTPKGNVPANNTDMLSQGLKLLGGLR